MDRTVGDAAAPASGSPAPAVTGGWGVGLGSAARCLARRRRHSCGAARQPRRSALVVAGPPRRAFSPRRRTQPARPALWVRRLGVRIGGRPLRLSRVGGGVGLGSAARCLARRRRHRGWTGVLLRWGGDRTRRCLGVRRARQRVVGVRARHARSDLGRAGPAAARAGGRRAVRPAWWSCTTGGGPEWELPGGMIDPGETPRRAAVRELAEETGVVTEELGYAGAASFRLAPDGRHEYAAVFRAELTGDLPTRAPDDEVDATAWWAPRHRASPGSAPLDAWLRDRGGPVTIHDTHPFADAEPDPARRLRGRLGGTVTLWTAGSGADRAGLTLTSVVVALGEPARLLGLVDPDSDFARRRRGDRRRRGAGAGLGRPRAGRGVRGHRAGAGRGVPAGGVRRHRLGAAAGARDHVGRRPARVGGRGRLVAAADLHRRARGGRRGRRPPRAPPRPLGASPSRSAPHPRPGRRRRTRCRRGR